MRCRAWHGFCTILTLCPDRLAEPLVPKKGLGTAIGVKWLIRGANPLSYRGLPLPARLARCQISQRRWDFLALVWLAKR
jgi:hypothetical protein